MTRRHLSTLAYSFALMLSANGCGGLLDYPEVRPELSTALCHNDLDDDLDGETDCADADCLGFCSEESLAECSDGSDNDGDGLTDAADPRCWLSSPPNAQRCAKSYGAEVVNHFDAAPVLIGVDYNQGLYTADWTFWGYDGMRPIVAPAPHAGPDRRDLLLSFEGNTTRSSTLDQNLGSYVRQLPFSGSLRDFELSFSAFVPPRATLRAGIVPVGLAPSTVPPIAGAETALLAVSIDTFEPPTLSLVVEGRPTTSPLAQSAPVLGSQPRCEATIQDCLGRVEVAADTEGIRATFTDADGQVTEVRSLATPSSLSVPPSRLVLWGGSADGFPGLRLDDLTMSVKPEFPCGFPVPQIPGAGCDTPWNQGYTVSTSQNAEGEYCALTTSSEWDEVEQRLAPPRSVTTWSSLDGDVWTPASYIPSVGTIVGAGIGSDATGLHAALALRDEATGTVRLTFADGASCAEWGPTVLGPGLPDDAEAPSYVTARGRHEVYFTRPPTGDARRTLWRIVRDAADADPEFATELPLGVEAPVSIQAVGTRDLVLAAPSRAGSGGRGVMLFVADANMRGFRPVGSGPVLLLPPSPDLPAGAGRLGFDDREVLSAALSFVGERGFLLYSGRSTEGALGSGEFGTPVLAVGTAHLLLHDHAPSDTAVVPEDRCGNGACDGDEDCVRCAEDCPCGGQELLGDVFRIDTPWQILSGDAIAQAGFYLGTNPPAMSFAGGGTIWAALPLEHPVIGDFELSFDALLERADIDGGLVYVGLGTKPPESPGAAPQDGVFTRIAGCFQNVFNANPIAVAAGHPFLGGEDCWGSTSQVLGTWQHVLLARRGHQVSVSTPALAWMAGAQDRPICETAETPVSYAGALPPLTHLLIGFGGGAFDESVVDSSPGTIANLTLRSRDTADDCPEPKERCDVGSEAPACVNLSESPEHCGACGRFCGPLETCINGTCVCGSYASVPGIVECGGACVDPMTSLEHCGGCDHACSERCDAGLCDLIVTGDCAAPFAIPPDGGSLTLGFPPPVGNPVPATVCDSNVLTPIIGAWTPTRSGTADIMVDVGEQDVSGAYLLDSVVAITDDATCSEWLACHDDIVLGENVSSHLTFPVEANKTYRIGVWLWDYRPPTLEVAELRVGFAP